MISKLRLTRILALLIIFYVAALYGAPVSAKTRCQATLRGNLCTSEVDFASFAQKAFKAQEQSQWCWAAGISMLFSYYNHPVSQERIVKSLYGATVNLPSGPGWNIASRLNSVWDDDNNKRFKSQLTAAFDADAGVNAVNNAWLVNELDHEHPFIIGTNGHAVVATAIQYFQTPYGPNVVGVGVFDPWPGRGARTLTPVEVVPVQAGGGLRFIATIKVSDL
jgi:hypothetical protein